LPFLIFDDEFLINILGDYHGELFEKQDNKKEDDFFCNAMMLFLEIDDKNVVHAYFFKEKSNIIVNHLFSKVKFKNSKSHKVYKLL